MFRICDVPLYYDFEGTPYDKETPAVVVDRHTRIILQVRAVPSGTALNNNYAAEMWSGSEEGSYLRLIHCCITAL